MNLATRSRARAAAGRPSVVPDAAGHQHVVEFYDSEDYALLGGTDAQQRAVAQLQQQTAALRAEVARLRADQIVAELDHIERLAARSPGSAIRHDSVVDRRRVPVSASPSAQAHDSPGGRLLGESLQSLSSRLRYAD